MSEKKKKEYKLTPLQKLIYILAIMLVLYGFWKMNIALSTKLIILGSTIIFFIATYVLINKRTLAGSTLMVIFILFMIFIMFYSQYIFIVLKNTGVIKIVYPPGGTPPPSGELGIGVYEDPNATTTLTQIDWGEITPASVVSVYKNVFIKNIGQKDCKLSMKTENWNPAEASNHIWLSWSYDNMPIRKENITLITFGLHVNSSILSTGITNFSFDIVIYVEEAT